MYCPLYPPEGGPVMGFACRKCGAVTRTQSGMLRHCFYVHNLVPQAELDYGQTTEHVRQGAGTESALNAAEGEQLFKDSGSSTYRDPSAKED